MWYGASDEEEEDEDSPRPSATPTPPSFPRPCVSLSAATAPGGAVHLSGGAGCMASSTPPHLLPASSSTTTPAAPTPAAAPPPNPQPTRTLLQRPVSRHPSAVSGRSSALPPIAENATFNSFAEDSSKWRVTPMSRFAELYRVEKSKVLGYGMNGPVLLGHYNYGDLLPGDHWKSATTSLNQVAVKQLHTTASDPREDAFREISLYLSLDHPNVARLFDVFHDPLACRVKLVMEYCGGGELYQFLQDRVLAEPRACSLAQQMARAVKYIHRQKVLHRDLSLSNWLFGGNDSSICLRDQSMLKLIDFGLAVPLNALGEYYSDWSETCGTIYYQAPETIAIADTANTSTEKKTWRALSDIWSLGVIFFILVSGSPPFAHEELDRVKDVILHTQPAFPIPSGTIEGNQGRGISLAARRLIFSLLEKDAKHRPQSAGEVLKHAWFSQGAVAAVPARNEGANAYDHAPSACSASQAVGDDPDANLLGGHSAAYLPLQERSSRQRESAPPTAGGLATASEDEAPHHHVNLLPYVMCKRIYEFATHPSLKQVVVLLLTHSGAHHRRSLQRGILTSCSTGHPALPRARGSSSNLAGGVWGSGIGNLGMSKGLRASSPDGCAGGRSLVGAVTLTAALPVQLDKPTIASGRSSELLRGEAGVHAQAPPEQEHDLDSTMVSDSEIYDHKKIITKSKQRKKLMYRRQKRRLGEEETIRTLFEQAPGDDQTNVQIDFLRASLLRWRNELNLSKNEIEQNVVPQLARFGQGFDGEVATSSSRREDAVLYSENSYNSTPGRTGPDQACRGGVAWTAFLTMCSKFKVKTKDVFSMFRRLDRDNDGKITKSDLREALGGERFCGVEYDHMLREAERLVGVGGLGIRAFTRLLMGKFPPACFGPRNRTSPRSPGTATGGETAAVEHAGSSSFASGTSSLQSKSSARNLRSGAEDMLDADTSSRQLNMFKPRSVGTDLSAHGETIAARKYSHETTARQSVLANAGSKISNSTTSRPLTIEDMLDDGVIPGTDASVNLSGHLGARRGSDVVAGLPPVWSASSSVQRQENSQDHTDTARHFNFYDHCCSDDSDSSASENEDLRKEYWRWRSFFGGNERAIRQLNLI